MTLELNAKKAVRDAAIAWLNTPEGLIYLSEITMADYDKGYMAGMDDVDDSYAYDQGYESGWDAAMEEAAKGL